MKGDEGRSMFGVGYKDFIDKGTSDVNQAGLMAVLTALTVAVAGVNLWVVWTYARALKDPGKRTEGLITQTDNGIPGQ